MSVIKDKIESFQANSTAILAQSIAQEYIDLLVSGKSKDLKNYSSENCFFNPSNSLFIISPSFSFSKELYNDLSFFLSENENTKKLGALPKVLIFEDWDLLPYEKASPSISLSARRISVLNSLLNGSPCILISSLRSASRALPSPESIKSSSFKLSEADNLKMDELTSRLDKLGYLKSSLTQEVGQYSKNGAILDFYSADNSLPYRLEFFSSKIESIRQFSPDSQRSLERVKEVSVLPIKEFLLKEDRVESFISKLRKRASEQMLPLKEVSIIENSLYENSYFPGIEQLLPLAEQNFNSLFDFLSPETTIFSVSKKDIKRELDDFKALLDERIQNLSESKMLYLEPENLWLDKNSVFEKINSFPSESHKEIFVNHLSLSMADEVKGVKKIDAVSLESFRSKIKARKKSAEPFKPVVEFLEQSKRDKIDTVFLASSETRKNRLVSMLEPYGFSIHSEETAFSEWVHTNIENKRSYLGDISVIQGILSSSLCSKSSQYQILSEHEVFPEVQAKKITKSPARINRLLLGEKLFQEGDFVVHKEYGIGQFQGLKQINAGGNTADYLFLEYAEKAKLFVPVDNILKVEKYVGLEGSKPKLSVLGGGSWQKTRKKIEEKVAQLAGELLQLYAEREIVTRPSFERIETDEQFFSESFPYQLTVDQAAAIEDVLSDLSRAQPMDRLVCGDVGFGKTEVALRAAFQVANSGKQVAVLVPTTVLAAQHYKTFEERFSALPIEVGVVSRFQSAKENKETLSSLKSGTLDIIVGTHRLLQRDVQFDDLALLVIDEEHRFGVSHKEKLKRYRKNVDVLSMTATPIPRTLQMSMLDIRGFSVIETAPSDRQLVRTFVLPRDEGTIKDAVNRELSRKGQVFFVHNRVESIAEQKAYLEELFPKARIAAGHGQMKEGQLAEIMRDFQEHKIDILLATTIIESGLDFPNANTIIINKAEMFGLAQLYQLRGRVGRSDAKAYAYLLTSNQANLGQAAKRRLEVLRSLDDLGVGFKLALQDMEIRGAGNILGKDQSGNVNAVGFEMYSRILKRAVKNAQDSLKRNEGESVLPDVDPEVQIGFPAYIPPDYLPNVDQRLLLYQRLVLLNDYEEAKEIALEIEDRFGRYPLEVETLIELMVFRARLKKLGAVKAIYNSPVLKLFFHPETPLDGVKLASLVSSSKDRYKISPNLALSINSQIKELESPIKLLEVLDMLERDLETV